MSTRLSPGLILGIAALGLAGCDSLDRALGLEKVVPDEFAVVSHAPLAIPPDYTLRPPRPGAAPTSDVSPISKAQQAIFKAGDQDAALPDADKRSPGENELLKRAGAASAPPDIRNTIATEARSGEIDKSFVDKLLIWKAPEYKLGPTDQVIDPDVEAQRLKGEQAAANASTPPGFTGAPVIERTKTPSTLASF
jgi:Protein of unknown function (DUF3035)